MTGVLYFLNLPFHLGSLHLLTHIRKRLPCILKADFLTEDFFLVFHPFQSRFQPQQVKQRLVQLASLASARTVWPLSTSKSRIATLITCTTWYPLTRVQKAIVSVSSLSFGLNIYCTKENDWAWHKTRNNPLFVVLLKHISYKIK